MYPCPGNWVATGFAAMYYARAVHALVQELNGATVLGRPCIRSYVYRLTKLIHAWRSY